MLKTNLPVLIIKNNVLFPYTELKFETNDQLERKIISLSENYFDGHLLVVVDNGLNEVNTDTLPKIGIVGQIKLKIDMPNGNTKINIKGINRVKVEKYNCDNNMFDASVMPVSVKVNSPVNELAAVRKLKELFNKYVDSKKEIGNSIINQIEDINTISKLTDIIISFIPLSFVRKVKYIDETEPNNRVEMLIDDLNYELSLIDFEQELDEKVQFSLDESQKEFLLREKIKIINKELGLNEISEYEQLIDRLNNFDCPNNIKKRLKEEIDRYNLCNSNSPEISVIRNYIETLFSIPWNKYTEDNKDIKLIKKIMDDNHYGLDSIKQRMLEFIATGEYNKKGKTPIICLVGPPGTGKTSIAQTIGKALNRNTVKISVGGINDEAEITGHRRTYVGSAPGKIIQGIKKADSMNPVFIIDEIDKMTKDIKGDPASSLLELLDREQNYKFVDHFIEEEVDLSNVMFVLTANYVNKIPNELKDRLEIIELNSYTIDEKLKICDEYIVKKLNKEYEVNINFNKETYLKLINNYTKESGVRELERIFRALYRKYIYNKSINDNEININEKIEEYLGKAKYAIIDNYDNSMGCCNGLSYSPYGGNVVKVETVYFRGNGKIMETGSLGNVMVESMNVAFDYLRSHTRLFNIDYNLLSSNDYHIHMPNSSITKEGPSAGITIVTSLISSIKRIKVSNTIAMSGEITLSGKILPVGGLKEKIIAALTNNVKILYLPKDNYIEVLDYKYLYENKIDIKFVNNYTEIYNDIFEK